MLKVVGQRFQCCVRLFAMGLRTSEWEATLPSKTTCVWIRSILCQYILYFQSYHGQVGVMGEQLSVNLLVNLRLAHRIEWSHIRQTRVSSIVSCGRNHGVLAFFIPIETPKTTWVSKNFHCYILFHFFLLNRWLPSQSTGQIFDWLKILTGHFVHTKPFNIFALFTRDRQIWLNINVSPRF